MTTQIFDSNDARIRWREILDAANAGKDTVIERYSKPTAVVIPYDDFIALQDALEDLRTARRAQAVYETWKADRSVARPYSEVRAELIDDGLLDG